jgi:galactose-1-phosphate uridylyltransferase
MAISLSKRKTTSTFLSPLNAFKPTTVKIEIRQDPLTLHRTRLVPYRFKSLGEPDLGSIVEESLKRGCPFCPEHLTKKAARFLEKWVPQGQIRKGEAAIFPNAFPYEKHNAVCVLCEQHFVPINTFQPKWIKEALLACQDYFRLLHQKDAKASHGSINWNFLPLSGAGLIHPHFQLIAQRRPTRYTGEILKKTKTYFKHNHRPFFSDFLEQEKRTGDRYIGRSGQVHWLSAFAPLGVMEIMALWEKDWSLLTLPEQMIGDFAEGLVRVLNFLGSKNIYSLNMTIFFLLEKQDYFPLLAKIIPRIELPPLKVSEINYFERLHHEILTFYPPEEVAAEIRNVFDTQTQTFFQTHQEVSL